jgi:hypothetical protein
MPTPITPQDSAKAWYRQYEWLQSYFPEEEAREYAEEVTQVAQGRKRETEKSPHEIRREMNLLMQIESLIRFDFVHKALELSQNGCQSTLSHDKS